MFIYSLRNLLICFAIVILVVLWIVFYTFSTLKSQEQEQIKVRQSREVLRVTGPSIINMQALETIRANFRTTRDAGLLQEYNTTERRLIDDSLQFARLATLDTSKASTYQRLNSYIRVMISLADRSMAQQPAAGTVENESGMGVISNFNREIDQLEDYTRSILNQSYDRSTTLTRRTIGYVTLIVGVLGLMLILSFTLSFYDLRNRKAKEDQLQKFNEELEKQVDQKTAEVRKSEERYRSLIEQASDAIMVTDEKGNFIEVNTALCTKFGYTREELMKMNVESLIDGDELKTDPIQFDLLLKGHSVLRDRRMVHKNGTIVNVEANVKMMPDGRLMAIARDITERKQAQEQITREKSISDSLINSLPGVFYLHDKSGKMLRWNKELENISEYSADEIAKMSNLDFFSDEDKETIRIFNEEVFNKGASTWEAYGRTKSGKRIPIYFSAQRVLYDGVPALIGTGFDITERKKTQQELIEAEGKFRTLVEQSLIGVYIIQNERFVYVNPQLSKIFGYTQEDLLKLDPGDVIMPEDQSMVARNVKAREEGQVDSIHYEAHGRRKDGELINIEVFCSGTLYVGSSAIIGTLLDITERKKAEEEIIKANERFSLIARATNDAVWDWDMVKDQNWGNDVFYDYYGTRPSDHSNYNTFLTRVHPEDRERILAKLQRAIERKDESVLDEFRFRMPDGHYRNFYDRAYIIYGKEGNPVRMLGSMMDITEKQLLEQEIVTQKIQAQKMITRAIMKAEENERNKIGQELHDNINQILVSIKMFLSMAQSKDGEVSMKLVQNSTSLIESAIQEIRLLSQSHVTPLKEINLKDLIESLMDKLKEGSAMTTSLLYNVDGQVIDEELKINLYRIIQEQINNIVKHANAHNVNIAVIADAEFLNVTITDDGRGFDTTEKRKGIGVSNMINRVESFNGEILIDSEPGKGCKVSVRIPC